MKQLSRDQHLGSALKIHQYALDIESRSARITWCIWHLATTAGRNVQVFQQPFLGSWLAWPRSILQRYLDMHSRRGYTRPWIPDIVGGAQLPSPSISHQSRPSLTFSKSASFNSAEGSTFLVETSRVTYNPCTLLPFPNTNSFTPDYPAHHGCSGHHPSCFHPYLPDLNVSLS